MADIVLNEAQFELLEKLMKESVEFEGEETDNIEGNSETLSDNAEKALIKIKNGLDVFYTALKLGTLSEEPFGTLYKTYAEPLQKELSRYYYHTRLYKNTHT